MEGTWTDIQHGVLDKAVGDFKWVTNRPSLAVLVVQPA